MLYDYLSFLRGNAELFGIVLVFTLAFAFIQLIFRAVKGALRS